MKIAHLQRAALALALTATLAACGGKEDQAPADQATDATAAAPADDVGRNDAPAAPAASESPLAVTDLDAYARGMQQEARLLQAASDKVAQARQAGDKDAEATAMTDMAMMDTEVEGAKASGLDQARYLFVKNAVDTALGKAEMQAALQGMGAQASADQLPPEQRQQVEDGRAEMQAGVGDPWAGLAPDVAAAMQARKDELARLRAQAIALRLNAGN
jgi:hypothetical protein